MTDFITPPNHFGFLAKKIYGTPIDGCITDCSVAYIAPNGGGPKPSHSHPHHHFFIVTEGEATVYIKKEKILVSKDEAIFVNGQLEHSIWNETNSELKMIGITITEK
jgi:mannose-6-phosphate isomerase-like protein (cupin superfamily)